MSPLSVGHDDVSIAATSLEQDEMYLGQVPESHHEGACRISNPFTALHFTNGFYLTSFDMVLDTEFVVHKLGVPLDSINEVTASSRNERQC